MKMFVCLLQFVSSVLITAVCNYFHVIFEVERFSGMNVLSMFFCCVLLQCIQPDRDLGNFSRKGRCYFIIQTTNPTLNRVTKKCCQIVGCSGTHARIHRCMGQQLLTGQDNSQCNKCILCSTILIQVSNPATFVSLFKLRLIYE